jgi:hypothetical protein
MQILPGFRAKGTVCFMGCAGSCVQSRLVFEARQEVGLERIVS